MNYTQSKYRKAFIENKRLNKSSKINDLEIEDFIKNMKYDTQLVYDEAVLFQKQTSFTTFGTDVV